MEQPRGRQPVFELEEEPQEAAKIKVIGLGGGGSNAVNRMIGAQFTGVEFIVANTDLPGAARLAGRRSSSSSARASPPGLGAGSDPEIGKNAALEDREQHPEAARGRRHGVRHRRPRRRHRHGLRARRGRASPRSWAS